MAIFASQDGNPLADLFSIKTMLPIEFTKENPKESSRMFDQWDEKTDGADLKEVASQPITFNYHRFGLHPEKFDQDPKLAEMFKVIAISSDPDRTGDKEKEEGSVDPNNRFVAIMESEDYKFYGTMFHPEKSLQKQN